jgi:hypothetical protein
VCEKDAQKNGRGAEKGTRKPAETQRSGTCDFQAGERNVWRGRLTRNKWKEEPPQQEISGRICEMMRKALKVSGAERAKMQVSV